MTIIKGLETTFNSVYDQYDKWRPTYVKELYKTLNQFKQLNNSTSALEVGIGTGQATLPILKTGCLVTAVELGDKLAEYTKKKFEDYDNFNVVNCKFEEFKSIPNSYDLIFSASAFHWIPEKMGYEKVFSLLKPRGVFARFANHPYKDKGREEMFNAIQELYKEYMPGSSPDDEYDDKRAKKRSDIADKYGFINTTYKLFKRTRTFTAKEYIALLGTYSDHIAIEETIRNEFFSKIERVIKDFGDEITLYDTIDLQLAIKPE
ncbi:class I SAM-dependent methyltransferase [Mycoplasmatota bacterium WC44]